MAAAVRNGHVTIWLRFEQDLSKMNDPLMSDSHPLPQPQPLSVGIANFKAFGPNMQTITLQPLTLVFGANGSGKSSAIHSLLWLKDAWRTGNPDVGTPQASGGSVNLGGFSQFRFKGDSQNDVEIVLSFDAAAIGFHASGNVNLRLAYGTGPAPVNLRRRTVSRDWASDLSARVRTEHPDWSEAQIGAQLIAEFTPGLILETAIGAESWAEAIGAHYCERRRRVIELTCPTVVKVWNLHPELIPKDAPRRREDPWFWKMDFPHTKLKEHPGREDLTYLDEYPDFDREQRIAEAAVAFLPTVEKLGITLEQIEKEFSLFGRAWSRYCKVSTEKARDVLPRLTKLQIEVGDTVALSFQIEEGERLWCRKLDIDRLAKIEGTSSPRSSEIGLLGYCQEFFSLDKIEESEPQICFDDASYSRLPQIKPERGLLASDSSTIATVGDLVTKVITRVYRLSPDHTLPLSYLGPLRAYPDRNFFPLAQDGAMEKGGGIHAWKQIATDEMLLGKVNDWLTCRLKTSYNLFVDLQIRLGQFEQKLRQAYESQIDHWIRDLKSRNPIYQTTLKVDRDIYGNFIAEKPDDLADDPGDDDNPVEMIEKARSDTWSQMFASAKAEISSSAAVILGIRDLVTGAEVSHRDVGVGVSQTLPVLVQAIASESKCHLIEQPELHLHPALQAELGDLFIESAMTRGNRFVLETHSEHLILRIMRRIRETTAGKLPEGMTGLKKEDVAVLYVERSPEGSIVREMPLNDQGELVKAWPGGFFEEGFNELFS